MASIRTRISPGPGVAHLEIFDAQHLGGALLVYPDNFAHVHLRDSAAIVASRGGPSRIPGKS